MSGSSKSWSLHRSGYPRKLGNCNVPRENGFRHSMESVARTLPKTIQGARWMARQKFIHGPGHPRKLRNCSVPRENGFRHSMESLARTLPKTLRGARWMARQKIIHVRASPNKLRKCKNFDFSTMPLNAFFGTRHSKNTKGLDVSSRSC